jgi:AcrR family transcriptional regulator
MPVPRRSDARRNREAILSAAVELLTQGAEFLSLHEIARRTGLGKATVYRHFSDRQTLALAVAEDQLAMLGRLAATSVGEPAVFRSMLRAVLLSQASMRPLVEVIRQLPQQEQTRWANRLMTVLRKPFLTSRAAGYLRDQVEVTDLMLALTMVEGAVGPAAPGTEAAMQRSIDLILDALFVPGAAHRAADLRDYGVPELSA